LNFGQLSLNITHCAAPQMDIKPRYPGLDSTLQPFGLCQQPVTQLLYLQTDRRTQLISWPSAGWGQMIPNVNLKTDRRTKLADPGMIKC
jgi:hypothetical protein